MRIMVPLLAHIFILGSGYLSPVFAAEPAVPRAGEGRVGPVYTGQFPQLEIVLEMPQPLTPAQLILLEDGRATNPASSLRSFQETGQGLALALALDVSGTLAGAPLTAMKRALTAFLPQLRPADRAALVTFADDWREEAAFGTPAETLGNKAQALQVRGSRTELYRGIFQTLRLFGRADELPLRKRVLVISDGHNEAEGYTLENVIRLAQEQQIPVDTIGLSRDSNSPYLSNLEKLSELTGGLYARAARNEDLEGIFRAGIERLQSTPVATFRVQNLSRDGQQHRVGVRLNTEGRLLSAETQLWLPAITAPTPGTVVASPAATTPAGVSGWQTRRGRYTLLSAGGVVLVLLLALGVGGLRRRKAVARELELTPAPVSTAALSEPLPYPAPAAPLEMPVGFQPPAPLPPAEVFPPVPSTDPLATAKELADADTPTAPDTAPGFAAIADSIAEPLPRYPHAPATVPLPRARARTKVQTEFRPPVPGHPSALLVAQEGWEAGQTFAIESSPYWIGSEEGSALLIPADKFLSGFHACIEFREGQLWLHDHASTNGTFLNEERLQTLARPLSEGDRVRVGSSVFVLKRV